MIWFEQPNVYYGTAWSDTMSGRQFLALAVIALQKGNKDDCLGYLAKAGEFQDDLTQFVTEVMQPSPTAVRNDGTTPQAENTIAPSLAAVASATDFISLSHRVSRHLAVASYLDEDDELEEDFAEEALDDIEFELEDDVEGIDEDLEDDESEEEDDDVDEEAVASADVPEHRCGPIRYKC